MECLVCPLHPHTTDNQQWKYMSTLALMVFCSRVNSSSRSGTDTRRHGRIRFYQAFISRPFWGPTSRWCLESQWPLQISPLVAVTSRLRDRSFATCDTRNQRKDAFSSKFFCWVDVEVTLPRGKAFSSCWLLSVRQNPRISESEELSLHLQSALFFSLHTISRI